MKSKILYLGIGFVFGAVAGIFGSKMYWKKKFEGIAEEQMELSREYIEKVKGYSSDISEPGSEINQEDDQDRSKGPLSSEERKKIKEKLNRNWEGTTNYASFYKPKENTEESDQNDDISEPERITLEHEETRDKAPEVIDVNILSTLGARWKTEVLYFYTGNEILVDDFDNIIEEPERILGDILNKWAEGEYDYMLSSQGDIIYVLNYELDTLYEIQEIQSDFPADAN